MSPFTPPLSRRRLLMASTAAVLVPRWGAAAEMATPVQEEGPFYPRSFPLDVDNDLVRVSGRDGQAAGDILHVIGRVLDVNGRPVQGAQLEIWQCDRFGVYHYVNDRSGRQDPDFQGYGRTIAAADGAYRFRTIRPVPYPGRTPHIHFIVRPPAAPRLTTQMYVAGEPRNDSDFLLRSIRDPAARARVIVPLEAAGDIENGALLGKFDIILGA
ncbi:MAG TPA: protocatechuate 3,4-dioxygenase [Alphaproteobacteria bacterium]